MCTTRRVSNKASPRQSKSSGEIYEYQMQKGMLGVQQNKSTSQGKQNATQWALQSSHMQTVLQKISQARQGKIQGGQAMIRCSQCGIGDRIGLWVCEQCKGCEYCCKCEPVHENGTPNDWKYKASIGDE